MAARAGWTKPQRRDRDSQRLCDSAGHDPHCCGHARKQLQIGIRNLHNHVVGDDVLHVDGRLADLRHRSGENHAGIGVHGKVGRLANANRTDVGLIHVGVHLHLGQILRDQEDGGRLKRCRHSLADIHVARDHRAVHRRVNLSVVQIKLA